MNIYIIDIFKRVIKINRNSTYNILLLFLKGLFQDLGGYIHSDVVCMVYGKSRKSSQAGWY